MVLGNHGNFLTTRISQCTLFHFTVHKDRQQIKDIRQGSTEGRTKIIDRLIPETQSSVQNSFLFAAVSTHPNDQGGGCAAAPYAPFKPTPGNCSHWALQAVFIVV